MGIFDELRKMIEEAAAEASGQPRPQHAPRQRQAVQGRAAPVEAAPPQLSPAAPPQPTPAPRAVVVATTHPRLPGIREQLADPVQARRAIVLAEVLDRPLALRQRRAGR